MNKFNQISIDEGTESDERLFDTSDPNLVSQNNNETDEHENNSTDQNNDGHQSSVKFSIPSSQDNANDEITATDLNTSKAASTINTSIFVAKSPKRYLTTPRKTYDLSTKYIIAKETRPTVQNDLRKLRD